MQLYVLFMSYITKSFNFIHSGIVALKMALAKKKKNVEERLLKKREAEKRRQAKIRENPERLKIERAKNHEKYLNRLKKGQVVPVNKQSARQKRMTRKKNLTNVRKFRKKKKDEETFWMSILLLILLFQLNQIQCCLPVELRDEIRYERIEPKLIGF